MRKIYASEIYMIFFILFIGFIAGAFVGVCIALHDNKQDKKLIDAMNEKERRKRFENKIREIVSLLIEKLDELRELIDGGEQK